MSETVDHNNSGKIPVILLVSMPHSGSTLLNLLMDSHSHVVGAGEVQRMRKIFEQGEQRNEYCTCSKRVQECPFWSHVFASFPRVPELRIARAPKDFFFHKDRIALVHDTHKEYIDKDAYIKRNEEVYEAIYATSGEKIIFDTSKSVHRAEILQESEKLDITLVHLVRDSRGVAYSYIRRDCRPWGYLKEWMIRNLAIEVIKYRNNAPTVFVNYEHFTKDPQYHMTRILNAVGLSFEPEMMRFKSSEHHQMGGNIFLKEDANEEITHDTKWKRGLSRAQKILIGLFYGWLNVLYTRIYPKSATQHGS